MVFAGTMLLFTPWVGVMLKASPEQIVAASAAISGVGFTCTVILNVPPEQVEPNVGVTVYSTVCTTAVVFLRFWLIEDCGVLWLLSPSMFGLGLTTHVYCIPFGTSSPFCPFIGITVNESFEHIAGGVLSLILIVGFTVIVIVN